MYQLPDFNLDGSPIEPISVFNQPNVLDGLKEKYSSSENWDLVPMVDATDYPTDGKQRVWVRDLTQLS